VSPSKSAGLATTVRKSAEVVQAEEMFQAVNLPKDAPADQKMAMLAVGGAYAPPQSLADRIRTKASSAGRVTRRNFNFALAAGWGLVAFVTATSLAMFQDFFGPKVLREPKRQWRVGHISAFGTSGIVDESFKKTPAGGEGFWIVNLQPDEDKLVALSTICTHLGCIPEWKPSDLKYKCPCHGSGYYKNGINFEGPTPRPLERFAISVDADGYVNVDQTKIYRQELAQWDAPESFISLS
jgi:cytochrome b6-f complex iron-sulfur subunit